MTDWARTPSWIRFGGLAALLGFAVWSFLLALRLPIDLWDGYDYLVNARLLAGHDLTHLAQQYRTDRPPGISLLVAPLLWAGYQPGQRGLAGLVHLVPWSLGMLALAMVWRGVRREHGVGLAFVAAAALALNALVIHFLPFIMADVASMTFGLLALRAAEQLSSARRWVDVGVLMVATALAMATKYPMALLGLAIPVANLAWVLTGKDRPGSARAKLVRAVDPKLALGLVLALGLFFGLHALIYSRLVPGDGPWMDRMLAGLRAAWAGGGGPGATDPWWELPNAVFGTFGAPVCALAVLGAGVVVMRDRDRAGWLHVIWSLAMMALFIFVIGHKESRYVMPALPSLVVLAARGASLFRSQVAQGAVAAAMLLGVAPSAVKEFTRMSDSLYTRPSLLAWARFALDRAGTERPIIQHPNISPFALYPKDPVVFANDEYWHYHHINHGGLEWFFDRRLLAFQIIPAPPSVRVQSPWIHASVPPQWMQSLGDDAVWLVALPKGGLLLSPPQGWYETASAAQQPEPPPPFVAVDLRRVTLTRTSAGETEATFSDGTMTVTAVKSPEGWRLSQTPADSRWFVGLAEQQPRRWGEAMAELPTVVDGLWSERVLFPVR